MYLMIRSNTRNGGEEKTIGIFTLFIELLYIVDDISQILPTGIAMYTVVNSLKIVSIVLVKLSV